MKGKIYQVCPGCGALWLEGCGEGYCATCVERMTHDGGQMDLEFVLRENHGRSDRLQEMRAPAPPDL